jgi:hypothetical protein
MVFGRKTQVAMNILIPDIEIKKNPHQERTPDEGNIPLGRIKPD